MLQKVSRTYLGFFPSYVFVLYVIQYMKQIVNKGTRPVCLKVCKLKKGS